MASEPKKPTGGVAPGAANASGAGTRRDTARVKGRDPKRETGRAKSGEPRKMRVAVFAPSLDLNGITHYTVTLLRSLKMRGDAVFLVAPSGEMREAIAQADVDWFELPPSGKPGFFDRRRLLEKLKKFEPSIMHAVCPDPQLPAVRAADALRVPLCVSVHGVKATELPRVGDTSFDGYVASDQMVRERLLNDCRLERDRATLIPDAAFTGDPPSSRHVLDPRRKPVVGCVGPLEQSSGHMSFVEAAIKVCARGMDTIFAILGSGPLGPVLRSFIDDRGMQQRIVLVERLFDYAHIWQPFDIAVIDTRQPAAAVMVLQAMAAGLPVISTEGGAVFDVIQDGVDGLLVRRDDADALADRLLMLIDNPQERLRMGVQAHAKIEARYSPEIMATSLATTYEALIAGEPLPKNFDAARTARR